MGGRRRRRCSTGARRRCLIDSRTIARSRPPGSRGFCSDSTRTPIAALEYERLRRALVKFFDWRGGWPPDECADETLDRLARKLEEAVVADIRQYARGIARLVLLERRRQPAFSSIDADADLAGARAAMAPDTGDEGEGLRDCFDRCLDVFPADSRALVIDYYEGEGTTKIVNRRQLAATLGLSDTALRSRVQRLRDRLERCVHECVSRGYDRRP